MRIFACLLLLVALGCSAPAPVERRAPAGSQGPTGPGGSTTGGTNTTEPSQLANDAGALAQSGPDGATTSSGPTPPGSGDAGANPNDSGPLDGASAPSNPLSCTPAGIAAYADALVAATRQSCTQDGVGVVDEDDYVCMQTATSQVSPPYPAASYNIVSTLLDGNTEYPFLECTYFVQAITTAVCNTAISPPGTPWADYPLAYTFAGQTIPGYTWIPNGQGQLEVGDIPVYQSTYQGDPGHIMVVAEVVDSTHVRVAEANELNSDGTEADQETGVVSNTRIDARDNPLRAGWFRLNGTGTGN